MTFRSAWNDPNALFVGFKAGDNRANHSHLDLGTFVFDALGVRWGVDLGADDYNLPGYFGGQRWNYYRLRAEGHNTLVMNPGKEPDQKPAAAARIADSVSDGGTASVGADLTAAYAPHARSVKRVLTLQNRRALHLRDEVRADRPVDLWWFFHTRAVAAVGDDGRVARLTQDGQELRVRLMAPPMARWSVMEATPLPGSPHPERQNANAGVRKLALHLPETTDVSIEVTFELVARVVATAAGRVE